MNSERNLIKITLALFESVCTCKLQALKSIQTRSCPQCVHAKYYTRFSSLFPLVVYFFNLYTKASTINHKNSAVFADTTTWEISISSPTWKMFDIYRKWGSMYKVLLFAVSNSSTPQGLFVFLSVVWAEAQSWVQVSDSILWI